MKKLLPGITSYRAILIILFLAVIILGAERMFNLAQLSILKENVTIIQGENFTDSNFMDGKAHFSKKFVFFGDRSLQLDAVDRAENGYYATYDFTLEKSGEYNILIAGTPPGPETEGSPWNSPYSVSIDNGPDIKLYEETIQNTWPIFREFNYAEGGYYFVKLLTVTLESGKHQIKFTIDTPRAEDGHYTFYIDAIILTPKGFRPFISSKNLPKELFQAL